MKYEFYSVGKFSSEMQECHITIHLLSHLQDRTVVTVQKTQAHDKQSVRLTGKGSSISGRMLHRPFELAPGTCSSSLGA